MGINEVGTFKPFVLKYVAKTGLMCQLCNWSKKCFGCAINADPNAQIKDIILRSFIAIEWDVSVIESDYSGTAIDRKTHKSVSEVRGAKEEMISLEDCLLKFQEAEEMKDKD